MADTFVLGSQLGSYRLASVIGASVIGGRGMSVVYRAEHVRLGTPVALKLLAPELSADEAFKERFFREVNLAAALEHPNVIPIHDVDVHEGSLYLVMRYVAGGDLRALLARTGPLDPASVSSVFGPVARALDSAHGSGLVHGDVKPSNILIQWSADGSVGHVYLTDFGMPRQASLANEMTPTGPSADGFDYLSPEQVEGRDATPQADIYSLGCVLYHALTGRVPFAGRFGGAGPQSHGTLEPPSHVRTDLSRALDAPLLKAMAKHPRERFASCGELIRAFDAALASEAGRDRDIVPAVAPPATTERPAEILEAPAPPATVERQAVTSEPSAAEPDRDDPATGRDAAGPKKRRISAKTAAVVGAALVAALAGYAASTLSGGSASGQNGDAAPSAAATKALAAKDPLRAIVAKQLPDFRCAVTQAPPGGPVREHAKCLPRTAGEPPIQRLTLTLFATQEALDQLFRSSRTVTGAGEDAAVRDRGECGPDPPWGGSGRWFRDADRRDRGGRMFCFAANEGNPADRQQIVWTVDDSLLLGEAAATNSADLASWWMRERDLRNPLGAPGARSGP